MAANPERTYTKGPPAVDWWIVSKCNLACDYCYGPTPGRDPSQLRPQIASAIALTPSNPVVTFCGGDPLVGLPVTEVLSYTRFLRASDNEVVLNTNGLNMPKLADALRPGEKLPFSKVGISIDGATEEMERTMRGPRASLSKAVDAAQWVNDQGVELKIATVVSGVNEQELPELARLVSTLKPKKWRLYQYSPRDNDGSRHVIEKPVFERAVARAKDVVAEGVEVYPADNDTGSGCFIVRMDGHVVWPHGNGYEEFPNNNVLETPIEDIWKRYPGAATVIENKKWHGAPAVS